MTSLIVWIKAHPRLSLAAGALVVFLLGGLAGRFLTTPRVEVRTETKTEWKDREVVKEVRVAAEKVYVDRVVWRDRTITVTKTPDGASTTVTHETEKSDTDTHKDSTATETKDATKESEGKKDEVKVVTPVLAQWRVGLDVGAALNKPLLPLAGPLVLGVRAERRILGPVWGGVWASTYGAAGAGLAAEF